MYRVIKRNGVTIKVRIEREASSIVKAANDAALKRRIQELQELQESTLARNARGDRRGKVVEIEGELLDCENEVKIENEPVKPTVYYRLYAKRGGDKLFRAINYETGNTVINLIYATIWDESKLDSLHNLMEDLSVYHKGNWEFQIRKVR